MRRRLNERRKGLLSRAFFSGPRCTRGRSRRGPRGGFHFRLEPLEARVVLTSSVIISEFQAWNNTTLADEDGDFEDWIELHNTSLEAVNLDGWRLTDDTGDFVSFPLHTDCPGLEIFYLKLLCLIFKGHGQTVRVEPA